MNQFRCFSAWYRALEPHRTRLFAALAVALLCCAALLSRMEVREDIGTILPDSDPELSYSLGLMELAPFSRMVFIQLDAGAGESAQELMAQAQQLRAALPQSLVPVMKADLVFTPAPFAAIFPSLADEAVIAALEQQIAGKSFAEAMHEDYLALSGAASMMAKRFIQYDPFYLFSPLYKTLESYRMADDLRVQNGFYVKAGGTKLLLMVRTQVAPTDSGNGAPMLAAVAEAVKQTVSPATQVTVFSGHRFAVENAATIKRDLRTVLCVSALGLLGIFALFIRSRDILWVVAVPGIVLLVSAAVLAAVMPVVSGITIGFGAVLLGISVDFSLHVYFALRCSPKPVAETLAEVSRPVLFGGLTSLAAFGALAVSVMPGIQQLAYFGITGLCCGMFLALVVLPHCLALSGGSLARHGNMLNSHNLYNMGSVGNKGASLFGQPCAAGCDAGRRIFEGMSGKTARRIPRVWKVLLVLAGGCLLAVELSHLAHVQLDSNLRSLSVYPPELMKAEQTIRDEWRGKNQHAIFFAEGTTAEETFTRGSALLAFMREHGVGEEAYSLSRLMPAKELRTENRERWTAFADANLPQMRQAMVQAQTAYGFSSRAFAPFMRWVEGTPQDISLQSLKDAGLASLVDLLFAERGDHKYVLTLVPDSEDIRSLARSADLPEGVYFYSPALLGNKLGEAFKRDFTLFVSLAFAGMAVLMLFFFRHAGLTLLAMLPLLAGLTFLAGVMRVLSIPFNLFSIAALPLIIGLAADYGIFIVNACREGVQHGTLRAVLVSGLTTVAGFGALAFAEHPAMYSLGITVLLGVGAAVPAAVFFIPAVYRLFFVPDGADACGVNGRQM